MKCIIVLLCVVMLSCFSSVDFIKKENFTFENSTELASHQTKLLNDWKSGIPISKLEIQLLEDNVWVASAAVLAPSNLVVRQWCLIDILKGSKKHEKMIANMVRCLSYGGVIFAEGYSYWLYTREMLDVWNNKFGSMEITWVTKCVDLNFAKTAYNRDGVFYPAPFGDVRDQPISKELEEVRLSTVSDSVDLGIVKMTTTNSILVQYIFKMIPIGLNTHIPKNSFEVNVVNGIPINFKFYEGYDKKYKDRAEESLDMLDTLRVKTIGKCN